MAACDRRFPAEKLQAHPARAALDLHAIGSPGRSPPRTRRPFAQAGLCGHWVAR
jgi:hypothetical protein